MSKRRLVAGLTAAASVAALTVPGLDPAYSAELPSWWIADSTVNVFYSETPRSKSQRLVMARNEYESFQVVVKSPSKATITSVVSSKLQSGSQSIAAENVDTNFVEYVYLSENSQDAWGQGVQLRYPVMASNAPGWFPEVLSNEPSADLVAGQPLPVWTTVYVPTGTAPGVYEGALTINTTAGALEVPYQVEVGAATIPSLPDSQFTTLNHQHIVGAWANPTTATDHSTDPITAHYGHERWTPKWWELVGNIAAEMKESRMNAIFINTPALLLDGGTTLDQATGKYTFDWRRFDEYVQFFIDRDMVKMLEGVYLAAPDPSVDPGTRFLTYALMPNADGELATSMIDTGSAASKNWLEQFVPALFDHLRAKGWYDSWYQQVADEPSSETTKAQYAELMTYLRAAAPEVLAGDASYNPEALSFTTTKGANVVVPTLDSYEENRGVFDAMRSDGVRVWTYNMCCSGANYYAFNRFVDSKVYEGRLLGWTSYKYGIDAYLHWAWNFWGSTRFDTAAEIGAPTRGGLQNKWKGDAYIVHPDQANNTVRATIRSEAMRDMAEDYELLAIASKKDPAKVASLIDRVAPSYNPADRPYDIGKLRATRDELVRLASQSG